MQDDLTVTENEESVEPIEEPSAPDPAAELAAREEAIAKRERELQKGFDEIARKKRELEAVQPEPADDLPEIPEDTAKALEKFMKDKFGGYFSGVEKLYAEMVDGELAKREDPDAIKAVIAEYGFTPKGDSLADVRDVFDKAEAIVKARSVDPDAMREQIRAEAEKEIMERLASEGIHVETIAPKRSSESPEVSLDDEDLDSATRLRLLKEKWPGVGL